MISEISQLENTKTNNLTSMSHLISQTHRKQKASGQSMGGKGTRELSFNGCRTSALQDEKSGGVSPITLWIYLIPLNNTAQNGFNDI